MVRKRLGLLAGIWIWFAGWRLRMQHSIGGSPIPGGYGVNIDWTRYQLVQTSHATRAWEPLTLTSSYAGAQNYDFGSYFLASINVMTGVTDLSKSLMQLNTLALVGLFVFPVIFLGALRFHIDTPRPLHYVLITALALFPAATTIMKTSSGWYPETIATATLLYLVLLSGQLDRSRSFVLLFALFAVFATRVYHTWVFIALLIVGTILGLNLLLDYSIENWESPTPRWLPLALAPPALVLLALTGRLEELITSLRLIFFTDYYDTFYSAAQSELISTGVIEAATNLNARRIVKITNYFVSVTIIAIYGFTRSVDLVRAVREDRAPLDSPLDRVVFTALFAFPVVILVFFMYGGLGAAIGRTHYVGVYFVLFSAILLIGSDRKTVRSVTSVLVVLIVVTAAPGAVLSGISTAPHTDQEGEAIESVGELIESKEYVFSTASLGPPLTYYDVAGVSMIRVDYEGWADRARAIYFGNNSTAATRAIQESIHASQLKPRPIEDFYLFLSSQPKNHGVPLFSFTTKPTPNDPRTLYQRTPGYQKIYSTGNVSLFYYDSDTPRGRTV